MAAATAAAAAAGGAYHSPQFSEDAAWLPPWLQPHRLPDFGGGDRDEQDASVPNGAPSQENCSSGQVGRLFAKRDAKYSGCHLYFSEDSSLLAVSHSRERKRVKSCLPFVSESGKETHDSSISSPVMHGKGMLFQGLDFLLTGFSSKKTKEIEELIRKNGGYVLSGIPSVLPDAMRKRTDTTCLKFPIVLSAKKTQTTKFLYGCATSGWILNVDWLVDSVQAGSLLPPGKYMFRPIQASGTKCLTNTEPPCFSNCTFIFDRVGIMLYGKPSFCTKFSKIIKHGGGQVFKSLQRLVHSLKIGKNLAGVVVFENEYSISRHLKHCALEQSLQTMPSSWIVNTLYSGKLLPFKKDCCAPLRRIRMPTFPKAQVMEMSQEI